MSTRLLIVTRHTPLPWADGAGAYLHDLAHYLAENDFDVEVLWLAPSDDLRWRKHWRLPAAFTTSVRLVLPGAIRCGRDYFFPNAIWQPLKARMRHRVRQLRTILGFGGARGATVHSVPIERPWMSPPTTEELSVVARHIRSHPPAVVIVSYAWLCPVLGLPSLRNIRGACLTHDVAWHRAQLASVTAGEPPAITRDDEASWLQSAGTIIAITEADAAEFRQLAPGVPVVVAAKACFTSAPMAVNLVSGRLLFVGSGNLFNAEGLAWFLHEVWPLVRTALPAVRLDVCGAINRSVSLRPEGVTFHGSVPDLAPFYRAASVVIVPLLHASGLNIKLIDGASAGRAVVASSITLAGAPFLRDAVHAADTAPDFAAAVQLLLSDADANTRAAAAGLAAVRAHLSPAACYGPLAAQLRAAA